MARLTSATVLTRPGDLAPTFLAAGSEVPDWAEGMVGDHLVEQPSPTPAPVEVATITDTPEPVKARTPRARKG